MTNEEIYNNLTKDEQQLIIMYTVARQFKDAVKNIISIKNISKTSSSGKTKDGFVPIANMQMESRVYPYIVNRAIACEIYLKLIISTNEANKLIKIKKHNLKQLYDKANISNKCNQYFSKLSKQKVDDCISNIANSFENWRYTYEFDTLQAARGFLNDFCQFLDESAKIIIKNKYGYNVENDHR